MTVSWDWPARPTLTLSEDDPGHRSIAQDYAVSDPAPNHNVLWGLLVLLIIAIGCLGSWKALELIGGLL